MSVNKYGFVYIWLDRKHKRYYIGCHWGYADDGYICSSSWMKKAYKKRPEDFKRRILKNNIETRHETYDEEYKWLKLIKPEEIRPISDKPRYYNLNIKNNNMWHRHEENIKIVGQKISATKKGRKTKPCDPSVAAKISEVKLSKRPKVDNDLMIEMFKSGKSLDEVTSYFKTHKRHIRTCVREMGYNNVNEIKPKREMPITMSREEQDKLCSINLRIRWADPEWAANQKIRLSEGAKKRPPRSEESKQKTRDTFARKRKERQEV